MNDKERNRIKRWCPFSVNWPYQYFVKRGDAKGGYTISHLKDWIITETVASRDRDLGGKIQSIHDEFHKKFNNANGVFEEDAHNLLEELQSLINKLETK